MSMGTVGRIFTLVLLGCLGGLAEEGAVSSRDALESIEKAGRFGELRALGAELFFAGKFDASVAAFDAFARHFPERAPELWERGISLYYAGRYDDGRKQFEAHQEVNPHDVENAAWHFICTAKAEGIQAARKKIIFIDTTRDTRIPMKEVYRLFRGEGQAQDVLKAAMADAASEAKRRNSLCFAHLYLGLYYEAAGDEKEAAIHIEKAATEFSEEHYMGKVAQVHLRVLKAKLKP